MVSGIWANLLKSLKPINEFKFVFLFILGAIVFVFNLKEVSCSIYFAIYSFTNLLNFFETLFEI